jgi:hypothetical protein
MPDPAVGSRRVCPDPVDPGIFANYKKCIIGLARAMPDTKITIRPTFGAFSRWQEFSEWLEPQLSQNGVLGQMADWAGKLAGAVIRIAGLLHLAENGPHGEIEEATINRAIDLGQYFVAHARATFGVMESDSATGASEHILRWLEGKTEFTKRECFCANQARLKQVTAMDAPLLLLERYGFIRPRVVERTGSRGRPAGFRYEVNPMIKW